MDIKKLIIAAHQHAVEWGFYECRECGGLGEYYQRNPDCRSCDVKGCDKCGKDSHGNQYCSISSTCPTCKGTGQHRDIGELLMAVVESLSLASIAHREGRVVDHMKSDKKIIEFMKKDDAFTCYGVSGFEEHFKNTFEDHLAAAMVNLFDLCGWLDIRLKEWSFDISIASIKNIFCRLYEISKELPVAYLSIPYYESQLQRFYTDMLKFCTDHEINIEAHIHAKMAYNKTRPRKHGKEY